MKNVAAATRKMIGFYHGNRHDIAHFLKVWALAKTIGELEGLDGHTQEVLELAAVVHDIACPLCREKYGDTNGKHQELEIPPLVEAFFADLPVSRADVDRISWLAAHHHTDTNVDGPDHRILLEADPEITDVQCKFSVLLLTKNIFPIEFQKLIRIVFGHTSRKTKPL